MDAKTIHQPFDEQPHHKNADHHDELADAKVDAIVRTVIPNDLIFIIPIPTAGAERSHPSTLSHKGKARGPKVSIHIQMLAAGHSMQRGGVATCALSRAVTATTGRYPDSADILQNTII